MYRKLLTIVLVMLSALIIMVFGYPVVSKPVPAIRGAQNKIHYSARCNAVSDFQGLIRCYREENILQSPALFRRINTEVDAMNPGFNIAFFGALLGQLILTSLFLLKDK